jgi:nanoRNase/pAp phosphatase (c-di-AMP/oligoRNAs hydrolase)
MALLVEGGVDRPTLEDKRRLYSKMPESIFRYKAQLIKRTELHEENQIAIITIPQQEINTYSPLYNPAPLIQTDMLQTEGVGVAIVIKSYDNGRITGAIRCNTEAPIAADIATSLGGGGHEYASGFKVTDGRTIDEVKKECLKAAAMRLTDIKNKQT